MRSLKRQSLLLVSTDQCDERHTNEFKRAFLLEVQ